MLTFVLSGFQHRVVRLLTDLQISDTLAAFPLFD